MAGGRSDDDWDLIEWLVRIANGLGMNGVRVRWRLMRMQQSWQLSRRRAEQRVQHVRYEHAICPRCGRVQDRDTRVCTGCGAPLGARPWQLLDRLGVMTPRIGAVSTLFAVGILAAYFRVMAARPGGGYLTVDSDVLVRFGAYYWPGLEQGQLWRHATAIFLHIGLWHLGFNLVALGQIGPELESVFGRGRMAFFFMLTGIVGFAACQWWGLHAISAGASGSIMGLIGAAAGWGQRDGTTQGHGVRNQMLKWGVYTMVFGFVIGANNIAHAAGFASGAVLGYATPPAWMRVRTARPLDALLGLVGLGAAAVAVALVLRPPAASEALAQALAAERQALEAQATEVDPDAELRRIQQACALRDAHRPAEALEQVRSLGVTDPAQLEEACRQLRAELEPPAAQPSASASASP